jgi:hypothetical protein
MRFEAFGNAQFHSVIVDHCAHFQEIGRVSPAAPGSADVERCALASRPMWGAPAQSLSGPVVMDDVQVCRPIEQ